MIRLTPVRISLAIALAVVAWMISGLMVDRPDARPVAESGSAAHPRTRVVVRESIAEPVVRLLRVPGRTAPSREATLAAETVGRIVAVEATRGERIRAGDVIARIDERGRREALAEARAQVQQAEIEYTGALELAERGFRAASQKAESLTALEAARSRLKSIELDLEATVLRAPFDGVLHERMVEVGDFVDVGNPVAVVVETDPFVVLADVAEGEVLRLAMGQTGEAELIDGRRLPGILRYIAPKADPATRTFRVELEVPNPEGLITTGTSADLALPVETVVAHRLSPSLLSLDSEGNPGIKLVGSQGRVQFHRVDIGAVSGDELIVDGLESVVTVITTGQGFVRPGDEVDAIAEQSLAGLDPGETAPQ